MNYLTPLEKLYRASANKEKADSMAKYMKYRFEYFGIPSPERTELERNFLKEYGKPPFEQLPEVIKAGYEKPQREFQYFVMSLAAKFQQQFSEEFIKTAKYMVVTKSWWDTVDFVAATIVGGLVKTYPDLMLTMDKWIQDKNMWLQRTAMLHQLKYRDKVDEERLFEYCRIHQESKEFFIRKAIGWALREYSKANPKAVMKFVKETPLSLFSKKEALKVIERK